MRKKTAAWLTMLLALLGFGTRIACTQEASQPLQGDAFEKQEKIYRSAGAAVPGGYVTYRSLTDYEKILPSGFGAALRSLGSADRWLDIGAGSGQAMLDYFALEPAAARNDKHSRRGGKAWAVAISIEDRRSDRWREMAARLDDGRIRYLFGKPFGEYSAQELGKFQLITDVYGAFSYTEDLSRFLERALEVLVVSGSFYSMLQSVHLDDGKENPRTWFLTELVDSAGNDVKICSWLRSIHCAEVRCESKSDWEAATELIHLRKVCGAVKVPRLKPMLYEAGNPPGRKFQLGQ